MNVKYQIVKKTPYAPAVRVGIPYKFKGRAQHRVDVLDNQYGAYVHFITTVPANPCDRDMSVKHISSVDVDDDILAVSTGSVWERS